ncbi:DEAD-domain-containing protein [Lanmaoa asiatica]|nr:DEAD-domain-containing protein [Lanmaoa asiatica]
MSTTKTKAKTRYLKRKKLRRKARKSSAPRKPGNTPQASSESGEDEEHHNDEEIADKSDDVDGDGASEGVTMEQPVQPPKKRRRVVGEGPDSDIGGPGEIHDSENKELPSVQRSLANPAGTLLLFPAPTVPNAPPKSVLAMQGIDKALIHAKVINPTAVTSLSTAEQDPYDTCLSWKTRRRLLDLGISELFADHSPAFPHPVTVGRCIHQYSAPHDVCISAPTGSGKTLAYVLPILEVLSNRIVTRLRALIVLPTRDLVTQVRETFEVVGKGHGLKIGTATGQHSFAHEQAQLVSKTEPGYTFHAVRATFTNHLLVCRLLGGSSKVDILICTPGRLMDHLNGTPNFSLQHLRFLVIDEADRLLSQSFQDWLAQVLTAIHWRPSQNISLASKSSSEDTCLPLDCDSVAPACLDFDHYGYCQVDVGERRGFSCQKLLFSATLTRDPGKLASLGLRDPKYFVVRSQSEGAYGCLRTIAKTAHVASPSPQPQCSQRLDLHQIIGIHEPPCLLLECFEELRTSERARITVRAYSSDLPAGERKTILDKFKAQDVHALVCSDLISRGIDINHVSHVVSYDTPVDMRKYVHRVGRTARAGRDGDAWTLVEEQEGHETEPL